MNRFIVAAAFAAAVLAAASSAFAVDCSPLNESKLTTFDWTRSPTGRPELDKPLRAISEACVSNQAGSGLSLDKFYFKPLGADKYYVSPDRLQVHLELLRVTLTARKEFGADVLNKMVEAIESELDTKVVENK